MRIRRAGKKDRIFPVEPGVYAVGSDQDSAVMLADPAIAWRHCVLDIAPGSFTVEDLTGGQTKVSGHPVSGRQSVAFGQEVTVGPYTLSIHLGPPSQRGKAVAEIIPSFEPAPLPPEEEPVPAAPPAATGVPGGFQLDVSGTAASRVPAAGVEDEFSRARREEEARRRSVRRQIQRELVQRLDIKRLTASHMQEDDLRKRAMDTIQTIIADVRQRLPSGIDPERLAKEVYDEAIGLGPLEDLLADPNITEIMVNGPERVYIEQEGKLKLTGRTFLDDDSVHAIIERIVSPIGRRIDESQPYVDARLPDGSRVNAIIHPLSLVGPCLTIRKFSKDPFTVRDLVRFGTWTQATADFLDACVRLRRNCIISGGTGSGKTTLLNVVSGFIPQDERIVTIEDAAELRLSQPHVIRLESRPPNMEGKGAVTVRDLVRNALRMRPDRIVVGECRGGEALDMLQAMNTGHEGSLTTVHANSPRDVISRLETMVLMSGMDLPLRAIREQIGAAIHLIIHEARFSDGTRKVSRITEVCGLEGDQITMSDIFVFEQTGVSAQGKVQGRLRATGSVPTFVEDMRSRGIAIDHNIFNPEAVL